jgi:glycosyltransferase involved in cell wall biosynthesis
VYGAEQVLLDLCAEMRELGHSPVIASIGAGTCSEKPLERAARERTLDVIAVRMAPGPNPRGALRLARLARDAAADLIHTHGYKGDILLGFLPRSWRPVPLVATVHGYTDVDWTSRMALYSRLDRLALKRFDRVVLVHEAMSQTAGLNRLKAPLVRVVENGIPISRQEEVSKAALDPAIVRFCHNRPLIVGAIGRLSKEKGFDILLRAASEVLRQTGAGGFVIFGDGPERSSLEQLSRELGLAEHVLLPGYRGEARKYLGLFHVFVLPSRTEGLPITLLEAMSASVPIIATKVGGVPRVLDDGLGGVLVEPNDASGLAEAIMTLLENHESAAALVAHSRAQVDARFSSRAMAVRYLDVYREMLS